MIRPLFDERGSATVLGLAISTVLLAIGFIAVTQVQATLASHGAQSAADLSALAGAQTLGDPCSAADHMANANHVRLASCEVQGTDVSVVVEGPAPSLVAVLFTRFGLPLGRVIATAVAGPA